MSAEISDAEKMRRLSVNLRNMLDERSWSASDLARGVWGEREGSDGRKSAQGRDRISAYLKGSRLPLPSGLGEIAKALGCKPADLLAPPAEVPETPAPRRPVEFSPLSFSLVPDDPSLALLRLNLKVPVDVARQIMDLVTRHSPKEAA
jgi:DNA-binding Xre family transcriptional regulator